MAMNQSRATGYALMAVLCWSTVATAFKLALVNLSPLQLLMIASTTASLFLLIILIWQGRVFELLRQPAKVYLKSVGFALLNPVLYYLILFSAYDQLPAQEAQALNYSWAIVLTLMAVPLLGHRLNVFDIVAAGVCYLGVLVIATRGALLSLDFSNGIGVALALLSTLVWSLYWILSRKDEREPVLGLTLNFLFSLPVLMVIVGFAGQPVLIGLTGSLGAAFYAGLVEMGLGFLFWLLAMKAAANTSRIANLIFLSPFLSLIFIALILGEPILASTLIGLILIVVGLVIQQFRGVTLEE